MNDNECHADVLSFPPFYMLTERLLLDLALGSSLFGILDNNAVVVLLNSSVGILVSSYKTGSRINAGISKTQIAKQKW